MFLVVLFLCLIAFSMKSTIAATDQETFKFNEGTYFLYKGEWIDNYNFTYKLTFNNWTSDSSIYNVSIELNRIEIVDFDSGFALIGKDNRTVLTYVTSYDWYLMEEGTETVFFAPINLSVGNTFKALSFPFQCNKDYDVFGISNSEIIFNRTIPVFFARSLAWYEYIYNWGIWTKTEGILFYFVSHLLGSFMYMELQETNFEFPIEEIPKIDNVSLLLIALLLACGVGLFISEIRLRSKGIA